LVCGVASVTIGHRAHDENDSDSDDNDSNDDNDGRKGRAAATATAIAKKGNDIDGIRPLPSRADRARRRRICSSWTIC
jgi:hypothetical protein